MQPSTTARRRAALAHLALGQDGLWTRAQARELGLDRDTPRRWVRSGHARQWNDRVFSDAALPDTWERRVRAAHLAVDGSVVVGVTAARLSGLEVEDWRIEISVARSTRHRPRGAVVHRPRRRPPTTRVRGMEVAAVADTILRLAAVLDPRRLEDVLADAVRRRLVTAGEVRDLLAAHVALPGRRQLVEALDLLAPLPWRTRPAAGDPGPSDPRATGRRSPLERRFAELVDRFGLPEPAWGAAIEVDGRRYELDAWWEDAAVAVELDGHRFHATPAELQSDGRRQNDLLLGGVDLLLRFTHDDVVHRSAEVARTVAAGLRR